MSNLENQRVLYILSSSDKSCFEVIPQYIYPIVLHRFTCKSVSGFMIQSNKSLIISKYVRKIYTNFFLSLGGYNFKINNLTYKTRYGMYFIFAEQFNVIPIVTRVLLLA